MNTFFAPPERLSDEDIRKQFLYASNNPVMDAVLNAGAGLLAILNAQRQIITVNKSLLEFLNVESPETVLGLRPGEALDCIHAHEQDGGCGTSMWCSTCGTAIAIVSTLADKKPTEKKCVLTTTVNNVPAELCFSVRSSIIDMDNNQHILLFLQDISKSEQQNAFNRMFNHDIRNILNGISGFTELLEFDEKDKNANSLITLQKLVSRLKCELLLHTSTAESTSIEYTARYSHFRISNITEELEVMIKSHPAAAGKKLKIIDNTSDTQIISDYSLLFRVLMNLVINAIEASAPDEEVDCVVEKMPDDILFNVNNHAFINPEIQRRIFQQYFSTKTGNGRGFGTFGTKVICEKYLNGKVDFSTSETTGTQFRVRIPLLHS